MPTSKSSTKMSEENIALNRSSQSAFTKAVKTIQRHLKKHEVPTEVVEQNTLQPGGKEKGIKKRVPKPSDRGVVYLRHIPHGFYEEPMKDYFSQFGQVTGIKVIRSQKTGNSCGYAFVEFLHTEVAKVVAETMNNYLMFDRLIKAEYVPPEMQKRVAFKRGLNTAVLTPTSTLRARNRANLVRFRNRVTVDPAKVAKGRKAALRRLADLEKKLEKEGIAFHIEPVDAEPAAVESSEDDAAPVLELDLSDSEFEFNVPDGTVVKPLKRGAPAGSGKEMGAPGSSKKGKGAATPAKVAKGLVTPAKVAKGLVTPAKVAKGLPTPAKLAKGLPTPAKKVTNTPKPTTAETGLPKLSEKKVRGLAGPARSNIPKVSRGGDQTNTTKEAQKQAAVNLFHQQMAKNRFGFGAKSNLTMAERMKKKNVKKTPEGLKSTPNEKVQENGDEKTRVSANTKRGGVPLKKKSKLIAPKAIAKKAILKHRGVKMTPKKTPKK